MAWTHGYENTEFLLHVATLRAKAQQRLLLRRIASVEALAKTAGVSAEVFDRFREAMHAQYAGRSRR